MATSHTTAQSWLRPITGPTLSPLELKSSQSGVTIGRSDGCDIRLPPLAEGVSRKHAMMRFESGNWLLMDLSSRWGTFLNGARLPAETEFPVSGDDLIGIGPWTFKLGDSPTRRALKTQDDTGQSIISSPAPQNMRPLAESLLKLLLSGASSIYAAKTEAELAEKLLAVAQAGTALRHAAVLKQVDAAGGIEVISISDTTGQTDQAWSFSRSLIAAAARGSVAELRANEAQDYGASILELNISCAICVPLMLGESPAAFLYLDSRVGRAQSLPANASAFCAALGAMGSLALANLKRIDLEKRDAAMRAELNAGAVAQRWIMPARSLTFPRFKTLGESRPGRFVGGDFFDLIDLQDGRLAVALGDVSGKGVGASVLMTAAQGYLHSELTQHGELANAVTALNRFVMPRRPEDRFLTMWVGVFDLNRRTIEYVDAGHGYALRKRGPEMLQLDQGVGMPIGVADEQYTAITIDLQEGDEVVIVSDGFVEQPSPADSREEFGMTGVRNALLQVADADPVAVLFDALVAHANSTRLADDATAVVIRCCP